MENKTVGALGFLDRKSMQNFCEELLGTQGQKVKTVAKYQDLLPLLQFKVAQGVVLPARLSHLLTGRSEMNLVVNKIPRSKVGLASVSILRSTQRATVSSAIRAMDGTTRGYLGVDSWK
jgi:hypothetical protein